MSERGEQKAVDCERNIEQARERIERAGEKLETAKTPEEVAEQRVQLAQARAELAETRSALAETRAEQAETTLQQVMQLALAPPSPTSTGEPNGTAAQAEEIQGLTPRQCEVLKKIAEGRNTKEIAADLNLSPKTVEYHRAKLMAAVGVHDIPGLVRLAMRVGLVPAEA